MFAREGVLLLLLFFADWTTVCWPPLGPQLLPRQLQRQPWPLSQLSPVKQPPAGYNGSGGGARVMLPLRMEQGPLDPYGAVPGHAFAQQLVDGSRHGTRILQSCLFAGRGYRSRVVATAALCLPRRDLRVATSAC